MTTDLIRDALAELVRIYQTDEARMNSETAVDIAWAAARAALAQPAAPAAWGLLDPATGKLHFELIGEYKDCEYWANEGTECRGWTITPIYTAAPAAPAFEAFHRADGTSFIDDMLAEPAPTAPAYVPMSESELDQQIAHCIKAGFDMVRFAKIIESLVVARMRGEGK